MLNAKPAMAVQHQHIYVRSHLFRCSSFKSQTLSQLVNPVTVTPHTFVSKAKAKTVMPKHAKGNEEMLEIIIIKNKKIILLHKTCNNNNNNK